ncbi:MAG: VWA domain-containing protein [Planctomycetaceae bacterium]|nr:VWA domain-containing protein [Planctomycetaceae bacterium]
MSRTTEHSNSTEPNSDKLQKTKLPAWIGSVLFHTFLLLLILYWFSLPSANRSAPGERGATGTITLQSGGNARQQAQTADANVADSELQDIATELATQRFATTVLDVRPVNPVLAPGQIQGAGGAAASELAGDFQNIPSGGVGNLTGATTVQLFGQSGTGTKFVYVFDRSASMDGRRMQMAKAELIRSLDALGDSHQFNIIFYNHEVQVWRASPRSLIYATPTNKQSAIRFIEGITPIGGTQHYHPLLEAISHRPDVIFFLTDGESQDDLTAVQLAQIEQANSRFGRGSQINVIQFGGGGFTERPSQMLRQLAEDNDGGYLYRNVLGQ